MKQLLFLLLFALSTLFISAQTTIVPSSWSGIKFEKSSTISKATNCNGSEIYIKKKVKAQLVSFYTDYPWIAVDFTKFKGQNGYNDTKTPGRIVYPYKIEMLVYLKRKVIKDDGKEGTEYVTWKYDSDYEYATRKGGKCDFRIIPNSQITLITKQVF